MKELVRETLKKIDSYNQSQIEIRPYCRRRMVERSIEESLLISTLFSKDLYYVKEQLKTFMGKLEKRHKLIFKISSKYSLIIIVVFHTKILKVVNIIKTSKGVEKKWQKNVKMKIARPQI